MPSIPDSTSKNFLDSGIQITLHGAKTSQLFRLNFFEREMAYVPTNYDTIWFTNFEQFLGF